MRTKILLFFAVPNGGWRNPVVAAKLKAEGVRSGVSDLIILHAGKTYFVEIKPQPAGNRTRNGNLNRKSWH